MITYGTLVFLILITGLHSFITVCPKQCFIDEKRFIEYDSFRFISCDSGSDLTFRNVWYLESKSPSVYPYSGFCRAMSTSDPQTLGSYNIRMDLLGIEGYHKYNHGNPGFLFNAQDPFTFEYVYFAPQNPCYRHGYYQNGKMYHLAEKTCRNGLPKIHTWMTVQMRVMSHQKTALLYRDGGLVAEIHPHFRATRWGGALTINGIYNVMAFRNYKLTAI